MKNLFLFLFINISYFNNSFAQNFIGDSSIILTNAKFEKNAPYNCWVVHPDSTFSYFSCYGGFEALFRFGKGKWTYNPKDTLISFLFDGYEGIGCNEANVKYECTTKLSVDSFYLQINLKGTAPLRNSGYEILRIEFLDSVGMYLFGKHKPTPNDVVFEFTGLIKKPIKKILFQHYQMISVPEQFFLANNYNFHLLTISVPQRDKSLFREGNYMSTQTFKQGFTNSHKISSGYQKNGNYIHPVNNSKSYLIDILRNIQKKQLYQKLNIDWLISELERK